MIKKKRRLTVLGMGLIVFGIAFIVPSLVLLHSVPNDMQFILQAPDEGQEAWALYQDGERMFERLSGWIKQSSITGKAHGMTLSTDVSAASVTLYAVTTGFFDLHYEGIVSGRLLSSGDIKNCKDVILIDEKLAYQLFPGADAIGKTVTLGEMEWTVVGLIRHEPRFGEAYEWTVFVPLSTSCEQGLALQTMEMNLRCVSNDTPSAILKNELKNWRSDGDAYELSKEKAAALMPLRWLLVILGCVAIRKLLRCLIGYAKIQYQAYRDMLEIKYFNQTIGWLLLKGIILLLCFLMIAGAGYIILSLVTQTALVFPDWIPENPVSVSSYISRFWSLHHAKAASIQFASRESSIIALAAWLVRWGCFLFIAGSCVELLSKRHHSIQKDSRR